MSEQAEATPKVLTFRIDVVRGDGSRYSVIASPTGYRQINVPRWNDPTHIVQITRDFWDQHVEQLPPGVELISVGMNSDWGSGNRLDLRGEVLNDHS